MSMVATAHWTGGYGEEVVVVPGAAVLTLATKIDRDKPPETFVQCSLRGVVYRTSDGARKYLASNELVWFVPDLNKAEEIAVGLLGEIRRLKGETVEGEPLPEGGS